MTQQGLLDLVHHQEDGTDNSNSSHDLASSSWAQGTVLSPLSVCITLFDAHHHLVSQELVYLHFPDVETEA